MGAREECKKAYFGELVRGKEEAREGEVEEDRGGESEDAEEVVVFHGLDFGHCR